jgi:glycosyltransferase involved in cell wall biosynthesis
MLNISKNIRFLGVRNDVRHLLSAADIYVMPSLWEGMPIALLEAMNLGLPILITQVEGVMDLIEHNESGFLVPPRDTQALVKGINFLIENPFVRNRLGARAKEVFLNGYEANKMCSKYEALFEHELTGLGI